MTAASLPTAETLVLKPHLVEVGDLLVNVGRVTAALTLGAVTEVTVERTAYSLVGNMARTEKVPLTYTATDDVVVTR